MMTIDELKQNNLILFECISGSKAFGLNTPSSDTDIKGVFYLPKNQFYGLNYIPQINNETNDIVYYELGRYVDLLMKNNPNMLELLATPADCVLYKHPIMDCLTIDMFLSKQCKETFAGYAITQIKKAKGLNKKIMNPLPKEKKSVLDFCFILDGYNTISAQEWLQKNNLVQQNCGLINMPHTKGMYAFFYDKLGDKNYKGIVQNELSNTVSLSSIPKGEKEVAYLFFNLDSYSSYCKDYVQYWDWVKKRNEERYQNNIKNTFDYDAKNMMHTIRLLQVAYEILAEGKLNVRRNNRAEMLDIKAGKYTYDEILAMVDKLIEQIESAYLTSALPDEIDKLFIENTLVKMREELYQ